MGLHRCDADQAWQLLLTASQAHQVRVGDLAAVVVRTASGPPDTPATSPLMDALHEVMTVAGQVQP